MATTTAAAAAAYAADARKRFWTAASKQILSLLRAAK